MLAAAILAPVAMLQAAPPEAPQSATAGPAQAPPAAPLSNLDLAGRQGEEGDAVHAPPLALSDPEANETWDLTMEEALWNALANSKVLRNLGGLLFTPAGPQSGLNHAAKASAEDSKAVREAKVRFVLARTNDDVSLADFESGVRNIVSDVERAYWELYYNYRNVAVVQAGRDCALQTWRKVYALYIADSKEGKAEKEAQVREQYFLFRTQVENSLGLLYTAESRLRHMMGLAVTDGRLLRPADEPTTAKVHFDLNEILPEALTNSVEVRRQRGIVKQHELKLRAARKYLPARSDAQSLHTFRDFGDARENNKDSKTDPKPLERQDGHSSGSGSDLKSDQYQERDLGFELTPPIGFRLAMASVRNAELVLAQSQTVLQDQEMKVAHVLMKAVRDLDRNYVVSVTTFKRRIATAKQLEAAQAL